ncbi:hypothetical protein D3C71_1408050 [compost metagenome]
MTQLVVALQASTEHHHRCNPHHRCQRPSPGQHFQFRHANTLPDCGRDTGVPANGCIVKAVGCGCTIAFDVVRSSGDVLWRTRLLVTDQSFGKPRVLLHPTKSVEKGKEQSISLRGDTERWLPRHSAPFLSPRIRRWEVRFTHLHYVPNTKHQAPSTTRIARLAPYA